VITECNHDADLKICLNCQDKNEIERLRAECDALLDSIQRRGKSIIASGEVDRRMLEALKAENERLRDALTWYESLLRHCGRVGIQGDAANIRLSADRGSVARAALAGGRSE
jgi:hypothetical protein